LNNKLLIVVVIVFILAYTLGFFSGVLTNNTKDTNNEEKPLTSQRWYNVTSYTVDHSEWDYGSNTQTTPQFSVKGNSWRLNWTLIWEDKGDDVHYAGFRIWETSSLLGFRIYDANNNLISKIDSDMYNTISNIYSNHQTTIIIAGQYASGGSTSGFNLYCSGFTPEIKGSTTLIGSGTYHIEVDGFKNKINLSIDEFY
jgi:hypothetical protein